MFNWFRRCEKPNEPQEETPEVPKYIQTIFESTNFTQYSDEMKKVFYLQAATIVQQEVFEVIATSLIRRYGLSIISDLDNTPIQTTQAELHRQRILAIEELVDEFNKASSRHKQDEDEKPEAIPEGDYFNKYLNNQ